MKKVGQIGFDFCDETPAYRLDEDWTWTAKRLNMSEHVARLDISKSLLDALVGIPHAVFSDVLLSVIAEHDRQIEWCGYNDKCKDDEYALWGHEVKFNDVEYDTLITHCMKYDGRIVAGVEYKVRTRPSYWTTGNDITVAMHAEGIGSIRISRNWGKEGTWHNIHFSHVQRDSVFLQGYQDDAAHSYCSEAVWAPAYSAQLIGEAHTKIPNVRTFRFGGREYVNTGASHCGDYSQCNAWAIAPADEWRGDTFNYAEMIDAWNRGACERGDMRGLLVRVRGQLCVLEQYLTAYDDQPRSIIMAVWDQEDDCTADDEDEAVAELEALYA